MTDKNLKPGQKKLEKQLKVLESQIGYESNLSHWSMVTKLLSKFTDVEKQLIELLNE